MADLTSVAAVKQWAGVSATDHDTLLSALVSGVSAWIENTLSRSILSAPYSEISNGSGAAALFLVNTPVTAVSAVKVDGVAIAARAGFGQSGYTFDEDAIYLVGRCFTKGVQNVQIDYTAGLADVPADLELAAKKLSSALYKERDRIGLSSKGLSGEQTNFITKYMPSDVEDILSNYRRVVPLVV